MLNNNIGEKKSTKPKKNKWINPLYAALALLTSIGLWLIDIILN